MSRHMRWLVAGTCAVMLVLAVFSSVVGFFYTREVACDMPCRDLGTVRDPEGESERDYLPQCAPLKLELELAEPKARMGRWYTLWYRVKMTNISCALLNSIEAENFINTEGLDASRRWESDLYLRVFGPDGEELPPPDNPARYQRTEYGDVIPYDSDHKAYKKLKKELKLDKNWFFDLAPGRSITSIPSIIEPYRDIVVYGVMRAENPGAPEPPPGFRTLDQFVFTRPGTYRIQAVYQDKRLGAQTIYRYDLPVWMRDSVYSLDFYLDFFTGWDFLPSRQGGRYRIRVESEWVEFEVAP